MGPKNKNYLIRIPDQPIRIETQPPQTGKGYLQKPAANIILKGNTARKCFTLAEIKKERIPTLQLFSALASQCCQGRKGSGMDWE